MKKRFVSFLLVVAMALGLVSSGFAAGVPDDSGPMRDPNRYYYTYETKPWGKEVELTVSETEAKVKDKIISIFKIKAYSRMNGTNLHSPVELQPEMHAESHLEEHPMSLL